MKTIYKLLVYSGNRLTHIHQMLKNFDERNIIMDGEIAHYPTSFLSSGTKSTFHLFFPASFIPEIRDFLLFSGLRFSSELMLNNKILIILR